MKAPFDIAVAHQFFSAACFNAAWTLIDQPERTADDNEKMLALAHASIWHWRERKDCLPRNLSIGYWQLSRVYSLIRHGERAQHYGQLCLEISADEGPFFLAYAHESLARAAAILGEPGAMSEHLDRARQLAKMVKAADDREQVLADLDTIALRVA
ncbi:MAG: hypothetical protein V4719_27395 [Planctomycetota bacterium]